MRSHTGTIRLALAFAALLAALTLVIHRQSHALVTMRQAEALRSERVVAEAERAELTRRIQTLESRAHVVATARARLGMYVPSAEEIVILPLSPAPASNSAAIARLP